jgi:hypothetical protein
MLRNQAALPFFEVLVNGEYLRSYATQVEIIQEINSHPLAFLQVQYIGQQSAQGVLGVRSSWRYIAEHTPIVINYGMKPGYVGQFLGYVESYKLVKTAEDIAHASLITSTVEYTIVGTSQVMQSTNNRTWKNTSPSAIAAQIAVENGFRAVVHPYVSAIDYRLQNVSDFKFLSQLAQEIGFNFYVDNTDLYFVNPKVILDQSNIRNIPQFWAYNRPGVWDTIRSFTPIVGTITPDGGIVANRTMVGLNPYTKNLVHAANQYEIFSSPTSSVTLPSITKYYNQAPAESLHEAQQKIVADTNRNLYWLTARSELRGDYRVKPNTLVNFVGTALPTTESGIWLAKCVTHYLTMPAPTGEKRSATYIMTADLIRDQVYTANTVNPGNLSPTIQVIPPKLIGGVWRSSNVGAQVNAN